ncbi:unnamed protein product [Peronospora belbahrii]|uniref:Uncharacterized protein n=1 Tax=Peronospora belbahrii TaxID=622444 RepID=A0ABN8CNV6_9STRA|nr:unnamed protein product [Peronospora belbahrii]
MQECYINLPPLCACFQRSRIKLASEGKRFDSCDLPAQVIIAPYDLFQRRTVETLAPMTTCTFSWSREGRSVAACRGFESDDLTLALRR